MDRYAPSELTQAYGRGCQAGTGREIDRAMRRYCKAYHLRDLRQFHAWKEAPQEDGSELTDETICYLWDDFVVVKSPVQEKGIIFDEVTPDWQAFCRQN